MAKQAHVDWAIASIFGSYLPIIIKSNIIKSLGLSLVFTAKAQWILHEGPENYFGLIPLVTCYGDEFQSPVIGLFFFDKCGYWWSKEDGEMKCIDDCDGNMHVVISTNMLP